MTQSTETEDQGKRTQLAFDIHEDIRIRIKTACARRNIKMNVWLRRTIYRALEQEEKA